MKVSLIWRVSVLFILVAGSGSSEELSLQPISAISPDKKFAMRVRGGDENVTLSPMDSSDVKAIELVALPSKKIVANLLPENDLGTNFGDVKLLWSANSQWCAFYYQFPRVGYTQVLRREGDAFVAVNVPGELCADLEALAKGASVRNEYVRPKQWTKTDSLVLEHEAIMRGDEEPMDLKVRLTARWDAKAKKFRVVSQNRIGAK